MYNSNSSSKDESTNNGSRDYHYPPPQQQEGAGLDPTPPQGDQVFWQQPHQEQQAHQDPQFVILQLEPGQAGSVAPINHHPPQYVDMWQHPPQPLIQLPQQPLHPLHTGNHFGGLFHEDYVF